MPNAGLDLGLWKGRLDGLREALEAVHDRDKDVLSAPVAQIVQHRCPDLGTLVGLEPQAQNVARAVRQDRQCDEDRLVRHRAVIADIDPDRVHDGGGSENGPGDRFPDDAPDSRAPEGGSDHAVTFCAFKRSPGSFDPLARTSLNAITASVTAEIRLGDASKP